MTFGGLSLRLSAGGPRGAARFENPSVFASAVVARGHRRALEPGPALLVAAARDSGRRGETVLRPMIGTDFPGGFPESGLGIGARW